MTDKPEYYEGEIYNQWPGYYECGICSQWHSILWNGDCRDDANRFNPEDLDDKHGLFGWSPVDMPGGEKDSK